MKHHPEVLLLVFNLRCYAHLDLRRPNNSPTPLPKAPTPALGKPAALAQRSALSTCPWGHWGCVASAITRLSQRNAAALRSHQAGSWSTHPTMFFWWDKCSVKSPVQNTQSREGEAAFFEVTFGHWWGIPFAVVFFLWGKGIKIPAGLSQLWMEAAPKNQDTTGSSPGVPRCPSIVWPSLLESFPCTSSFNQVQKRAAGSVHLPGSCDVGTTLSDTV